MKPGTIKSLSLLKISGADAQTFLQGQLSNDVNLLDNTWQYTGYCNPKGRLLTILQLWRDTDTFYALIATDLVEQTTKRLRMYVMRSKVTIETMETSIYGFSAYQDLIDIRPGFIDHLKEDQSNAVYFIDSGVTGIDSGVTDIKSGVTGREIILTVNERCLLISDQTKLIDHDYDSSWVAQNISAGIPEVSAESTELFIPQMVNLDLLDGINFKKGCYTGQEIIARMHYLGNLKQRMFVCKVDGETTEIMPGDKVVNNLSDQKTKGTVVSTTEDQNLILAVLKLADIDQTLCLENGQKIRVTDTQPYPLETPK